MSSILTNNSAMVALQTLKSINSNLQQTQSEISTGKSVSSAKDNAAVWAISKVMESDVKGFDNISESLALGESTVAVAANASETITDLLTDIKGKIVAAQESNVDRDKIQTDITALADQIKSVTNAAQFNGLNLVRGGETVDVLSSLDRQADGQVVSSKIQVDRTDLRQTGAALGEGADITVGTITDADNQVSAANNSSTVTIDSSAVTTSRNVEVVVAGVTVSFAATDTNTDTEIRDGLVDAFNVLKDGGQAEFANISVADNSTNELVLTREGLGDAVTIGEADAAVSGSDIAESADKIVFGAAADRDSFELTIGQDKFTFTADGSTPAADIATNLADQINAAGIAGIVATADNGTLRYGATNGATPATSFAQKADGDLGGALQGLASLNVTTNEGATQALSDIEDMITYAIDAAASFGSARGRIETQSDFISKLTDSLTSGIGALVDADMEETSAKLQALQVQQQLGVQALSIANQSPQSILSLFR
ncbi:flagellin [Nereida sp. MMG025]|uniref:flagellin N-terminal helical domain-containing protein n=1 Tax=Nereida sp. MMG025 TaxID=2909981 RepID=UPI001F3DE9C3|nr:flagellin [Nereida sp. MMG025]MCF6444690.1 flagellin [Nereida sp. MMG025]